MRLPHRSVPGRRVTKVWDVPATTNVIAGLADELFEMGIERCRPRVHLGLLEGLLLPPRGVGLLVWLVNRAR